jgi:hypothetical protein
MPVGLSVLDIDTDIINPLNTNNVNINGAKIKGTSTSIHIGNTDMASVPPSSVIVGVQSAINLLGDNNVAIGYLSMNAASISTGNVCVGSGTGSSMGDTVGNTFIGNSAGTNNTSGIGNTAVGNSAGLSITTGNQNTFIGDNSGAAFPSITGSNITCIGKESNPTLGTVSNQITLGNSAITTLRCAVTTITSLSDARDKKNIEESKYGLDLVESLKPVTFEWETRDGGKKDIKDLGFIAQDLKEVDDDYLGLVYDENPEKLEASYGRLIPVLVKAIQELSEEVKQLKNK